MKNGRVKKALIPAAGLGTRFLPATKTVPKEMLTIVDAPVILYVIEEAIKAGIEDIVLIQGRGKTAIEDFFDISYELEDKLQKDGKQNLLEKLLKVREMANIISIRQKQPLGLGHAVLCGEAVIGDEPFAVLLGDEITIGKPGEQTTTGRLVENYSSSKVSTIGVMEVLPAEVSKYGIAEVEPLEKGVLKVTSLIEKPSPGQTKSRWALPGRYVLDGKIFGYLKNTKPGKGGEIQLTDALAVMLKDLGMQALPVAGDRYDAGDKFGFIKANVEIALQNPEIGDAVRQFVKDLAKKL